MNRYLPLLLLFIILQFTSCKTYGPSNAYSPPKIATIDYSNLLHWAAHPDKRDNSDKIPGSDRTASTQLRADVFFIHPTIYNGKGKDLSWNPSITDLELNKKVDNSTIQFQASAFNAAGRVFAPRYRQAHLVSYSTDDKASAKKAFELAYSDVKNAFEHYLKYYNNGRPIVIASHSQGTTHAGPLIREFFDNTPLQQQLVAAYLIGLPVPKDYFKTIFPCEGSNDLGCVISWRTFKRGHLPDDRPLGNSILVTNPLSWKTDTTYVSKNKNLGAILRDFNKVLPQRVDAQVHDGILWAKKPRFPWSFLFRRKNYHVADINFYYMNIKENAKERVTQYLRNKQ
ncbi:DUF3089 domain-containing protein [Croceitalea sp. MTPC9]|uniref:DUF3089 domain-containing protein n=1 Tax=unclassified Croceitalea TaxID=2632280 RepID=UPI002B3CBFF5|nr:DUF3089 domain-containing protein [Croceitalea sp. MTPC6]GMN15483.1 DUF3089 domain-containing protein [Croceitalea sp. MTPC9]